MKLIDKLEIRVPNLPYLPSFIDANNLTKYIIGEVRDLLINPFIKRKMVGKLKVNKNTDRYYRRCMLYLSNLLTDLLIVFNLINQS